MFLRLFVAHSSSSSRIVGSTTIPHYLSQSILYQSNSFLSVHDIQTRSYAQKKEISFKKQQNKLKELQRKEKAKKEEKDAQKKAMLSTKPKAETYKTDPSREIPAKPELKVIPIPTKDTQKALKTQQDPLYEFFASKQNVALDATNGLYGIKDLQTLDQFDKYINSVIKKNLDAEVKNVEALSTANSWTKEKITSLVSSLHYIDLVRWDMSNLVSTTTNVHSGADFVASIQNLSRSLESYYRMNVDEKEYVYPALKTILSNKSLVDSLNSSQVRFLEDKMYEAKWQGLHLDREKRAAFKDMITDYENKLDAFVQQVKEEGNLKVDRPSRLYNIPRHIYNLFSKTKLKKKKKFANVDMTRFLDIVLEHVSVEKIRQGALDQARSLLLNPKSQGYTLFASLIESANQVAASLGYPSVVDLNNAQMGLHSESYKQSVLEVLNTAYTGLEMQQEMSELEKLTKSKNPESALRSFDTLYLEHQRAEQRKIYDEYSIRKYFPVHRCFEGLINLTKSLFNLDVKTAKLAPQETWYPTEVKKLEVVDASNKVIGIIYLDLYSRTVEGLQKPEEPMVLSTSFVDSTPSVVISMNLEPFILGTPTLLDHQQLRQLFHVYGNAIATILARHNSPLSLASPVLKSDSTVYKSIGYLMERFAFDSDFISSFAKHYNARVAIFNQYIQQLIKLPYFYKVRLASDIALAHYDYEVFGSKTLKDKPEKLFEAADTSYVPSGQVIPNLSQFSQFGGKVHCDLYAQMVASHLWYELNLSAKQNQSSLSSAIINANNADELVSLATKKKLNVQHFIKDVNAHSA